MRHAAQPSVGIRGSGRALLYGRVRGSAKGLRHPCSGRGCGSEGHAARRFSHALSTKSTRRREVKHFMRLQNRDITNGCCIELRISLSSRASHLVRVVRVRVRVRVRV